MAFSKPISQNNRYACIVVEFYDEDVFVKDNEFLEREFAEYKNREFIKDIFPGNNVFYGYDAITDIWMPIPPKAEFLGIFPDHKNRNNPEYTGERGILLVYGHDKNTQRFWHSTFRIYKVKEPILSFDLNEYCKSKTLISNDYKWDPQDHFSSVYCDDPITLRVWSQEGNLVFNEKIENLFLFTPPIFKLRHIVQRILPFYFPHYRLEFNSTDSNNDFPLEKMISDCYSKIFNFNLSSRLISQDCDLSDDKLKELINMAINADYNKYHIEKIRQYHQTIPSPKFYTMDQQINALDQLIPSLDNEDIRDIMLIIIDQHESNPLRVKAIEWLQKDDLR